MGRALSVVWKSIVDLYGELFPMVGANIVWFAITFVMLIVLSPLLFLANAFGASIELVSVALVLLLVLAPSPAAAGLHNYANTLVKEEHVDFSLIWEGLRQYWAKSLLLFAAALAGATLLVANAIFYFNLANQQSAPLWRIAGVLFIYMFALWIAIQTYALPLLIEQENKSFRLIIRNAALLCLDNPFFTFTLLLMILLITVLSLALPIFITLISGSLVGIIQHRAVLTLLEKYRKKSDGRAS